jgi:hypothetical protein
VSSLSVQSEVVIFPMKRRCPSSDRPLIRVQTRPSSKGDEELTAITDDHVEWAIVRRFRLLLEEPPHKSFNVTQSYSPFTAILCWVMQHIRINVKDAKTANDQVAAEILKKLSSKAITEQPWSIQLTTSGRIGNIGAYSIHVPAPVNFDHHPVERFLINLRDATTHGDECRCPNRRAVSC